MAAFGLSQKGRNGASRPGSASRSKAEFGPTEGNRGEVVRRQTVAAQPPSSVVLRRVEQCARFVARRRTRRTNPNRVRRSGEPRPRRGRARQRHGRRRRKRPRRALPGSTSEAIMSTGCRRARQSGVLAITGSGGLPMVNFAGGADGGDGSEPVRSVLGEGGEGGAEKWSRQGGAERLAALKAGVGLLGPAERHSASDAGAWRPRGDRRLCTVGMFVSARGRKGGATRAWAWAGKPCWARRRSVGASAARGRKSWAGCADGPNGRRDPNKKMNSFSFYFSNPILTKPPPN
jgi:hypothetical protein